MPPAKLPPIILAETLLREWELHAARPTLPEHRPALLAQLAELCTSLQPGADIAIDYEDLRSVLHSAAHFRVGTYATAGPNRAISTARALLAAIQKQQLAPVGPAQRALLNIISPAAEPLHMDELTLIIETLQHTLGQDAELIFGHDETADSAVAELRGWLLVGYGTCA